MGRGQRPKLKLYDAGASFSNQKKTAHILAPGGRPAAQPPPKSCRQTIGPFSQNMRATPMSEPPAMTPAATG